MSERAIAAEEKPTPLAIMAALSCAVWDISERCCADNTAHVGEFALHAGAQGCDVLVDPGPWASPDPWADLAVATWSTECNYGAEWEQQLLEAYGVHPEPQRIAYCGRLWALT